MNSVARINLLVALLWSALDAPSAFGNTVLGAAVAATVFLRRWKGSIGRREGPMQLRHVLALGPRERLALVKVGSRFLVVGVTAAGISAVAEFTDETLDSPAAVVPMDEQQAGHP